MTARKLWPLLAALIVIIRARVALLPCWVVPLPALLLAAEALACATIITALVVKIRRDTRAAAPPRITTGSPT